MLAWKLTFSQLREIVQSRKVIETECGSANWDTIQTDASIAKETNGMDIWISSKEITQKWERVEEDIEH